MGKPLAGGATARPRAAEHGRNDLKASTRTAMVRRRAPSSAPAAGRLQRLDADGDGAVAQDGVEGALRRRGG
jgi:hypothetical protein